MEETENKYTHTTLNGNWYEKRYLKSLSEKDRALNKRNVKPYHFKAYEINKSNRITLSNMRTILSYREDGQLHDGDRFMLQSNNGNVLSADLAVSEKDNNYRLFCVKDKDVNIRKGFSVKSVEGGVGKPIRYGDKVIVTLVTPSELCNSTLYIASRIKDTVTYTEDIKDQDVFLTDSLNSNCHWVVEPLKKTGNNPSIVDIQQVCLFKHSNTNKYLNLADAVINNDYGTGYKIATSLNTFPYKEQILYKDLIGQQPSNTKIMADSHKWQIVMFDRLINIQSLLFEDELDIFVYDLFKRFQEKIIKTGVFGFVKLRNWLKLLDESKTYKFDMETLKWATFNCKVDVTEFELEQIMDSFSHNRVPIDDLMIRVNHYHTQLRVAQINKAFTIVLKVNPSLNILQLSKRLEQNGLAKSVVLEFLQSLYKDDPMSSLSRDEFVELLMVS